MNTCTKIQLRITGNLFGDIFVGNINFHFVLNDVSLFIPRCIQSKKDDPVHVFRILNRIDDFIDKDLVTVFMNFIVTTAKRSQVDIIFPAVAQVTRNNSATTSSTNACGMTMHIDNTFRRILYLVTVRTFK